MVGGASLSPTLGQEGVVHPGTWMGSLSSPHLPPLSNDRAVERGCGKASKQGAKATAPAKAPPSPSLGAEPSVRTGEAGRVPGSGH